MVLNSKIEWTDTTWNPMTGCSPVSAGCKNCWAKRMATRQRGRNGYDSCDPFRVTLRQDKLDQPYRWKKPRKIAVCLMGDLFHEDVPFYFIHEVFRVMGNCPRHIFQVLTKRPARALEYFGIAREVAKEVEWPSAMQVQRSPCSCSAFALMPHIWFGVSVEDQKTAEERIPLLLQVPASVRYVSAEPLLGSLDLHGLGLWYRHRKDLIYFEQDGKEMPMLDWVIIGGESGPGARVMDLEWPRMIIDQCQRACIPVYMKQIGSNPTRMTEHEREECGIWMLDKKWPRASKGNNPAEWPADLCVRLFPDVAG